MVGRSYAQRKQTDRLEALLGRMAACNVTPSAELCQYALGAYTRVCHSLGHSVAGRQIVRIRRV